MASKKSNKPAKAVDVVASNPSNSEDKKVKELANPETPKVDEKKPEKKTEKKDAKAEAKADAKVNEKKDTFLREERDDIKEKDDEEIVDRKVFHPVRGSSSSGPGVNSSHAQRGRGSFQHRNNERNEGKDEQREFSKKEENHDSPQHFRGRGNRGGRGNFRGRGAGNRPRKDEEGGRQGYVNPRDNPSTWFKVITHKSPEAWSHFRAKTQDCGIKHYEVMVSKLKGEARYAHPQEEEIKTDICLTVDGHKGNRLYLVRGREYYISMVGYSGNQGVSVGFTSSCTSAAKPFSWLPIINPGQTLHVRINASFPDHFYYQDTKERFIGGPVIVARNFEQKRKGRETTSGTCSDEEGNSTDTQYDD